MKSLYEYLIQTNEMQITEAFIDSVFASFKKNNDIMQRINKAKNKIDTLAKSTIGTYKSVGNDGIKAWIGDITYLLSNDEVCKDLWEKGVYKAMSQMNDKSKKEIILDMYNNKGKGYKDIYDLISTLTDKMSSEYKWKRFDQTIYVNDNEEPDNETNYDLFINTLQIIAVQIKKQ